MKYQAQLTDLSTQIAQSKNVLVTLPNNADVDKLSAGLALYLSLKQSGKEVSIATETPLLVNNSNLFGVGEIQNKLPTLSGGDLVITLGNVVMPDGKVPGLEKVDWYPEGPNLNFVLHAVPGQRFEPSSFDHRYTNSKFDLIFVIGAASLNNLGNIYTSNIQAFTEATVVNVDNNETTTNYGKINIVDPKSSGLAEMVAQILPDLNLSAEGDIANNILTGIYDATANLTKKTNPETFLSIGQAMQMGGKVTPFVAASPVPVEQTAPVMQPVVVEAPVMTPSPEVVMSASRGEPSTPSVPIASPFLDPNRAPQSGFDLRNFTAPSPVPVVPAPAPQVMSQPVTTAPVIPVVNSEAEVLATPQEGSFEGESEFNPSPDWLTPKVYKSGGLG